MRYILTIILSIICSFIYAQNRENSKFLKFNVKAIVGNNGDYILQNKKLRTEFTIKGFSIDKYSVDIINSSISILSKYESNSWIAIDSFKTECYISDTNELYLPLFEITDFNKDGYQDLTCLTETNINGNHWIYIFLFNPKLNRLEKLKNTAEIHWKSITDIWDNPKFNSRDSTINCFCDASAYGISFESKYKLKDYQAIPIEKEEENRSRKQPVTNYYKGINGKWVLKKVK